MDQDIKCISEAKTVEEFREILFDAPEREILHFIAENIFVVKQLADQTLPMLESLGKSPMGKMLGIR